MNKGRVKVFRGAKVQTLLKKQLIIIEVIKYDICNLTIYNYSYNTLTFNFSI